MNGWPMSQIPAWKLKETHDNAKSCSVCPLFRSGQCLVKGYILGNAKDAEVKIK